MIPLRGLLFMAMVSGACAAPAAEERLISAVAALYRPGSAPAATRCGSAVLREVAVRWRSLSAEARQQLEPLLRRPDWSPPGLPAAPATAGEVLSTAHFRVHFQRTGPDAVPPEDADHDGVPDHVQRAGRYLEQALEVETGAFGYRAPAALPVDVFMRHIAANGLTHYAPGGPPWKPWIEIQADIESKLKSDYGVHYHPSDFTHDPEGVQIGELKGAIAHELFHVLQAEYDAWAPAWWHEGTADWMCAQVFPETGYKNQFADAHLVHPERSLFAEGNELEYSASFFPTFLSEDGPGAPVVRAVWEKLAPAASVSDPAAQQSHLEEALAGTLGNVREEFVSYVCHNALLAYRDTWRLAQPRMLPVGSYPALAHPPEEAKPEPYGANFYELALPPEGGALALRLDAAQPEGFELAAIAVRSPGDWQIVRARTTAAGRTVHLPVAGLTRAIAVVAHVASGASDYQLAIAAEP